MGEVHFAPSSDTRTSRAGVPYLIGPNMRLVDGPILMAVLIEGLLTH